MEDGLPGGGGGGRLGGGIEVLRTEGGGRGGGMIKGGRKGVRGRTGEALHRHKRIDAQ